MVLRNRLIKRNKGTLPNAAGTPSGCNASLRQAGHISIVGTSVNVRICFTEDSPILCMWQDVTKAIASSGGEQGASAAVSFSENETNDPCR